MTKLGARRWATITLVVLIIGVAAVAISLRQGMKQVWDSVVYTDWTPKARGSVIPIWNHETRRITQLNLPGSYYRMRQQRWSWLPGQDAIRFPINKDEYESMLEERNRRAKGGQ